MAHFVFSFSDHSGDVHNRVRQATAQALEQMGAAYESNAKGYSPVRTGRLRGSITHVLAGTNEVDIGTSVNYGVYQEFGTYKMAAHPFMRPAGQNHISQYEAIAASVFKSL